MINEGKSSIFIGRFLFLISFGDSQELDSQQNAVKHQMENDQ